MTPQEIKKKYEKRIIAILSKVKDALTASGHDVSDPYEMDSEYYRWDIVVDPPEPVRAIAIFFEIATDPEGVNFAITASSYEGQIIGGLTPHNYTPECWVSMDDENAIESRFRIHEKVKPRAWVRLISDWLHQEKEACRGGSKG